MQPIEPGGKAERALEEALGYLNFGTGATDTRFLQNLNDLFHQIEAAPPPDQPPHELLQSWLTGCLERLRAAGGAFRQAEQAKSVLGLLFDELLPAYRRHHCDLLGHQDQRDLWCPLFLGRAFEAILAQQPPWGESQRIVQGALAQLNDFVGYRPVAVLDTEQEMEPYDHERVRPLPVYIRGVSVGVGRYEMIVTQALQILARTDPQLLDEACFDLARLQELAVDPRAYDFGHPVHKRPNYQFGQWDPHAIDRQGYYCRFVVQQTAIDALLARGDRPAGLSSEQWSFEAAAVLTGVTLMASGTSGWGPGAHWSTTTLGTLLSRIAAYRDRFYESLLDTVGGSHGQYLRDEAIERKQPFAGARQDLNRALARSRARQLHRYHLARLFADMGHPQAARDQAAADAAVSLRITSQIECQRIEGHQAIDAGRSAELPRTLAATTDLVHRGVACGALIDPWNIVGFDGNYSLFPAVENTVHDHRADQLVELVEALLSLAARGRSAAAAAGDTQLGQSIAKEMGRLAQWWDRFGAATVPSVQRLVASELETAAEVVSQALQAWRSAGSSGGDIAFWRQFVDQFDSPRSFAAVIDVQLDQGDHVASMALLMQWLSRAEEVPLGDQHYSFHNRARRWLADRIAAADSGEDVWPLVRKFFDFLEANAQQYWSVPEFELAGNLADQRRPGPAADSDADRSAAAEALDDDADDAESTLFSAAYEEVTYRDSTADGVEDSVLDEGGDAGTLALEFEARRLDDRLAFLTAVAQLWHYAAVAACALGAADRKTRQAARGWQEQAAANQRGLLRLVEQLQRYAVAATGTAAESLVDFDRRRRVREMLLDHGMTAAVATLDAERFLRTAARDETAPVGQDADAALLRAVLGGSPADVAQFWQPFLSQLEKEPLLYRPVTKGGAPGRTARSRATVRMIAQLLEWLPRRGLLRETAELLETAQHVERAHPVRVDGVTEFNQLFEQATRASVEAIVAAADEQTVTSTGADRPGGVTDQLLVNMLERWAAAQLPNWLAHSRSLRHSSADRFAHGTIWRQFVDFVTAHGHALFTQQVLSPLTARSVLAQGAAAWLAHLEQYADADQRPPLLDALAANRLPLGRAAAMITAALEVTLEHEAEYREYNATTTQSDRGEWFHMFVDFLRLKSRYDRLAWDLKPGVIIHRSLVETGREEAAALWRRSMADHTAETADQLVRHYDQLVREHAMRLPTVGNHLRQRFVQPLEVDRLRALVRPAMAGNGSKDRPAMFALLREEIDSLVNESADAGVAAPTWLEALQEEAARIRRSLGGPRPVSQLVPRHVPTWSEVQSHIGE